MNQIDDNTLAAYLECTLSDEERERVEQAIEEDDELKAVVDEWLSMADCFCAEYRMADDSNYRMEACSTIGEVMSGLEREPDARQVTTSGTSQVVGSKPVRHNVFTIKRILVAASLLVFVSVVATLILKGSDEGGVPSFDVPMGGYTFDVLMSDSVDVDSVAQIGESIE